MIQEIKKFEYPRNLLPQKDTPKYPSQLGIAARKARQKLPLQNLEILVTPKIPLKFLTKKKFF
jgi:hypothetical protein